MKKRLTIVGMVLTLTLSLGLAGCGKNETKTDGNYIVSTGQIELDTIGLNTLSGTAWAASPSNDDYGNQGRIDFLNDTELFLMVINGQTGDYDIIEKGDYVYEDGKLKVNKDSAITAIEFGEKCSIVVSFNNGYVLTFRYLKNEPLMPEDSINGYLEQFAYDHPNQGQSEENPAGSDDSQNNNQNENGTKPTQDSDGKYVYNVSGIEVHVSVNIWDYIDGDNFDLYKMLRDNGLDLQFWHCKATVNGSETTVDGYPHYARSSNGDYIFFNSPPQRNPSKNPKNSSGLAVMNGIGQANPEVTFEPSANDIEESTYRVSGTEIGMSLDQAIIVAVLIDGTNNGTSYQWYEDTFGSWQSNRRYFSIP